MEVTINNTDDLLNMVRMGDISPVDAIGIFERAFNVDAIILTCAISNELATDKETVISTIEGYIKRCKAGTYDKVVLFG